MRSITPTIIVLFLVVGQYLCHLILRSMPQHAAWRYNAQRGFYSHDSDPESWEFRATTRAGLGILNRSYPTDDEYDPNHQKSQWDRLRQYVKILNQENPETTRYKVVYVVRHGEGAHNVKENEVGRAEWDRKWAKLPGDGNTTWLDAELTSRGEQQARDIAAFWTSEDIPPPETIYSSPSRRCLHTTMLAFKPFLGVDPSKPPMVKERLRERLGVHTCDQRSSRTWIAEAYPAFKIEDGFTEADELWQADRRETFEEHVVRSHALLEDIYKNDKSAFISLTAHSGAIMALFAATGWKKVPVAAGAVYPLLICATRVF